MAPLIYSSFVKVVGPLLSMTWALHCCPWGAIRCIKRNAQQLIAYKWDCFHIYSVRFDFQSLTSLSTHKNKHILMHQILPRTTNSPVPQSRPCKLARWRKSSRKTYRDLTENGRRSSKRFTLRSDVEKKRAQRDINSWSHSFGKVGSRPFRHGQLRAKCSRKMMKKD